MTDISRDTLRTMVDLADYALISNDVEEMRSALSKIRTIAKDAVGDGGPVHLTDIETVSFSVCRASGDKTLDCAEVTCPTCRAYLRTP